MYKLIFDFSTWIQQSTLYPFMSKTKRDREMRTIIMNYLLRYVLNGLTAHIKMS